MHAIPRPDLGNLHNARAAQAYGEAGAQPLNEIGVLFSGSQVQNAKASTNIDAIRSALKLASSLSASVNGLVAAIIGHSSTGEGKQDDAPHEDGIIPGLVSQARETTSDILKAQIEIDRIARAFGIQP